jgi:hypothetical protein
MRHRQRRRPRRRQPNERGVGNERLLNDVKSLLLLLVALWYIIQSPGVVGEEIGKKRKRKRN